MSDDTKMEVCENVGKTGTKDRFPTIVLFIILTEFCERMSYSGMKAFLALYLRSKLGYTDDGATETYHVFTTFAYVFPIMGGIVADNYLGKYRTILYMMFVYASGNLLVAVTAIPQLALPGRYTAIPKLCHTDGKYSKQHVRLCTLIGLFMITIGTGGIKPCVTAFGGDQFKLPEQENQLAMYFSVLYFMMCSGSLLAKFVSPILRSEVHCFGDKDCYSLAFGLPGLVILMSVVIFVSVNSRYNIKKPEGNVVLDFIRCISLGVKNIITGRGQHEKNVHWLNTTESRFDKRFIRDIKKTLSILTLFSMLPVFWSLLDQMGSRWTLQATKMDGRLGPITVKPDQVQVVAPIVILILIPLTQKYIYPYLEKRNLLKNPLHKLSLGMILAALSFIMAGVVEIYISTTYPQLPQPGYSQIRIFNGQNCSITVHNSSLNISSTIPPLSQYSKKDLKITKSEYIMLDISGRCVEKRKELLLLEENKAVSFFLDGEDIRRFIDNVDKSRSGLPVVRFLKTHKTQSNFTLIKGSLVEAHINSVVSSQTEVFAGKYDLLAGGRIVAVGLEVLSGGVYTLIVDNNGIDYRSNLMVTTDANSITMALLLPQFLIMSTAEVLFAVTGNEFAFKEAPDSMKAVMTAAWLLTEAAGNVIIIVVTRLMTSYKQETQFFFYTCLMFVSLGVFHYLSKGYQFGHSPEDQPKKERRSNSEVLYMQVRQAEDCLDH